ncbi:MAG TPA: condensation domain-containing protein, partial [Polyangiales bacterium]|nr:condensation domain-containing protein [Polyangiales bacterium]
SPCGFRDTALFACYGLAEATLLVSGSARDRLPVARRFDARALEQGFLQPFDAASAALCHDADGGMVLVGCGRVQEGHQLRIAAEGGAALPDGQIGEIWFAGPSVTAGYFDAERATRESFVEHEGTRYLRTGDLGALLKGELFVAGRHKDLIIVRGRNLFPEDIEHCVESAISLLQKGRVAAFGERIAGEEAVVVAVEVSRGAQKLLREEALVAAICEAVARTHLEAPQRVLLLKPGALPKTSSGKLRRRAAATAFRAGTLGVYAHYFSGVRQGEPTTDVAAPQVELTLAEQRIAALWKELLGLPVEQPHASFFALGGNSVLAAQLVVRIEHELGVELPLSDVYAAPSLRSLAARVVHAGGQGRSRFAPIIQPPLAASGATSQCLALTAAQRSLWLAIERDPQLTAFHLSVSVELRGQLDMSALRHSMQLLMQRHDALRTSIELHGEEPLQRVHHTLPAPEIYEADMEPAVRAIGRAEALRALVECQVERGFELQRGPLWACALARLDAATSCLVLTAHHLVLDRTSLEIVLQDLAELYEATCARRAPQLPVPVSVRELLAAESARASSGRLAENARAVLDAAPLHLELPLDHPRPSAPTHRAERVTWAVPEPLAAELFALARAHGLPVSSILLAALSVLMQRYTGAPAVRIGLPLAHRHGALASRAVSLCMRMGLLALPIRPGDQLRELLPLVAAQLARMVERRVLTPELLSRSCASGRDAGLPRLFDVAFQFQEECKERSQWLGAAEVLAIDTFSGFTPFDLTLSVQAGPRGRLACHFEYATELFALETVQRLASDYASVLATLSF